MPTSPLRARDVARSAPVAGASDGAAQRRVDPILFTILLVALGLRLWGLRYGLPHVYNPDEVSILSRALSLGEKGLNPGNFVYPSLYFYVLAAAIGAWFGVERLFGHVDSIQTFERAFWQDPSALYLVGRSLSVAAGVISVAATYALARRLGSRALARSAALLMAVAYIPVRDAHMVKHDVVMTMLATLVVLAAWTIWQRGRGRDYVRAGGLAGMTFAMHYYAALTIVPVVAAHALRTGLRSDVWRRRGIWIALGTFALAFAVCSPYVLIDRTTAIRDIVSNREIVLDRARATYGLWGSGLEQARLLVTQGAGGLMTVAAIAGVVMLFVQSRREAVWLFSFPIAFGLFLTQTWPFGRLQNVLYPFIAVAAAVCIDRVSRQAARPRLGVVLLTLACAAQPLLYDVWIDRLLTRTDTRTEALEWIAAHVPAGAGIAVQPYSVPLEPTAAWLRETIARQAPGEPLGARARGLLARDPYPPAAYRLFYLGQDGMDRDKIYIDPEAIVAPQGLSLLRRQQVEYVVIKETWPHEADTLRGALAAGAALVYRASPFAPRVTDAPAQLPDYDIRPSLDVTRPGPVIEVWRLTGSADGR